MPVKIKVNVNGKDLDAEEGKTILDVCKTAGADIPLLCYFEGLGNVGACRLCLVEVEGSPKLFPACTTPIRGGQVIRTDTAKLQNYRRMLVELFFSERNHICSICVSNNHCELQDMGYRVGMDHVRFPYLYQECRMDASHKEFVLDHNRCIMCTRCVRVCDEVENAHNWDVMGRGYRTRIIADFNEPWGDSTSCTSCGKCIEVCPTGALWTKKTVEGTMEKDPQSITELIEKKRFKS